MSSEKIETIAIVVPKADKVERFVGLLRDICVHVEKNEPGTLRYQLIRSKNDQTGLEEIIMVETYANKAAQDIHKSSEPFKQLYAVAQSESLLHEDRPVALKIGKAEAGFTHRL